MSSRRFPGKALVDLCGKPMIGHVVERVGEAVGLDRTVLATSSRSSDDPLAEYVKHQLGVRVFRGSLANVVDRIQQCLRVYPSEWFVRICGDSPAIDPTLLKMMLGLVADDIDLITNIGERTFPAGQSVEVVRSPIFLSIDSTDLDQEEMEHPTSLFYNNTSEFKIVNVICTDPHLSNTKLTVDTPDDLRVVETILSERPDSTRHYGQSAQIGSELP